VVQQLTQEIKTAANIKDRSTGKAVVQALKSMIEGINKTVRKNQLPENGLL
jgi:peptide subunit release factor 1 (eRF1)